MKVVQKDFVGYCQTLQLTLYLLNWFSEKNSQPGRCFRRIVQILRSYFFIVVQKDSSNFLMHFLYQIFRQIQSLLHNILDKIINSLHERSFKSLEFIQKRQQNIFLDNSHLKDSIVRIRNDMNNFIIEFELLKQSQTYRHQLIVVRTYLELLSYDEDEQFHYSHLLPQHQGVI